MKPIAIIPARSGSTRIPRKNIKPFFGKPIIAYSLETAKESGLFDRIIVTTDDKEIAALAVQWGATDIHERRPEHAKNEVGTQTVAKSVIEDYLGLYEPDFVCVIYATAPLMTASDLRQGFNYLRFTDSDFVFAVGAEPKGTKTRMFDAGQWYWGKTEAFLKSVPLVLDGNKVSGWRIPPERVCDVNTLDDWKRAEGLYIDLQKRIAGGNVLKRTPCNHTHILIPNAIPEMVHFVCTKCGEKLPT